MMPTLESFVGGIGGGNGLAIFAGFAAFTIFLLLFDLLTRENFDYRASVIDRHRKKLKNDSQRRVRDQTASNRPRSTVLTAKKIIAFLPDRLFDQKRNFLRSAGFRADKDPLIYWGVKIFSLCIIVVGAVFGFFWVENTFCLHMVTSIISFGVLSFIGSDIFVHVKRQARLRKLGMALPDGLDLLVICSEAGLSLDASLKRVADEVVSSLPELSEELFLTSVEMNFLPDRRQALANLSQRVELPAFRGVTSTLIQTEKYGTPLAHALRTLSSEFRETRLLKAEEKAARLPAILTVPMICFILPALFLVLTGPAFVQVYRQMG